MNQNPKHLSFQMKSKGGDFGFLFVVLSVWTLFTVGRMQDIFTLLMPLRPALVTGLITSFLFLFLHADLTPNMSYRNSQVKLYMVFVGTIIVSIPFASYRRGALEFTFTQYLSVVMFFLIFFKVINSAVRLKKILFIVCFCTVTYSATSIIAGKVVSNSRLAFGNMFDPNDLAFFFLSFLPFNLLFVSKGNSYLVRIICGFNLLTSSLATLMSGSRGGLLGFVVMIMMLFVTRTRSVKLSHKVFFLLACILVVIINLSQIDVVRYQTLTNLYEDYNITGEMGRLSLWKQGVTLMFSHPFTGVGVTCFDKAIGENRMARGEAPAWQTAHNSFIQVGAELGIFSLLIFLIITVKCFGIFRRVRDTSKSNDLQEIGEMARIGFVGHVASIMFLSQAYSVYWVFYVVVSAVLDELFRREMAGPVTSFSVSTSSI